MREFTLTLITSLLFILISCGPSPVGSMTSSSSGDAEPPFQRDQATAIFTPEVGSEQTPVVETASEKQAWEGYNHEPWGLTFDYPADWQIDLPDFNAMGTPPAELEEHPDYTHTVDLDTVAIGGYELKVLPSENPNEQQYIALSLQSYTLAPGMTLAEWITLHQQYGRREWGYEWENYKPALESFPAEHSTSIDEIWMESTQSEQLNKVSIWMSVGKLVYLVYGHHADENLTQVAEGLDSSLEFDPATQQALEKSPYYSVDATVLQISLNEQTGAP